MLETEQSLIQALEQREVQDESQTVYAHKLSKAEAQIDWSQSAADIDRNIRAFNPWPVAFTPLDDTQNLRLWMSQLSQLTAATDAVAGQVIAVDAAGVHVCCGDAQVICLSILQWPGAKAFDAAQILQSNKLQTGHVFA